MKLTSIDTSDGWQVPEEQDGGRHVVVQPAPEGRVASMPLLLSQPGLLWSDWPESDRAGAGVAEERRLADFEVGAWLICRLATAELKNA